MNHPVGVLDDPLEAVLGQQDRDAEIVDQTGDGGQHLLGGRGVEGGGRLIENENTRVGGEHGADGHPLLLPARQLVQGPTAQVGDAQQVERLLHALAHHVRRDGELLHPVGQLLFDGVGHEAGQRVLSDHPDDVGQLARRMVCRVAAIDHDPASQRAAGEVRDKAVDRPQQRRLADARATDDHAQLALRDAQRDVPQHRPVGARIADRHTVKLDHAATPERAGRRPTDPDGSGGSTVAVSEPLRRGLRTGGGAAKPATAASRIAAAGTSGNGGNRSG